MDYSTPFDSTEYHYTFGGTFFPLKKKTQNPVSARISRKTVFRKPFLNRVVAISDLFRLTFCLGLKG